MVILSRRSIKFYFALFDSFAYITDMEQDHLGNFFTKLFYSDVLYPSFAQPTQADFEFPSVVAPDLSKAMVT